MTAAVRVPDAAWNEMLRHATDAAPAECCGLLLGQPGRIIEVAPAANIDPEPLRRFLVDPAAHFAAIRRGRLAGVDVIGAYHSHPRGAPVPSETDLAEALPDETFLHVIVAPLAQEIAAYCWREGGFVAVPLERERRQVRARRRP